MNVNAVYNEVTEEDLEEILEEFKERALRFIPLTHFEGRAPGARDRVATASSLRSLEQAIESFLERTKPDPTLPVDVGTGKNGMTAQISVHSVITRNLQPIRDEIIQYVRSIVIFEDDEELGE